MIRFIAAAAATFAIATAANAEAPADIAAWQQSVQSQFETSLRTVGDHRILRSEAGTVLVKLDAEGRVIDTTIGRSTGTAALDREALAAARAVRFPALPEAYGRKPVTVAMNAFFGTSGEGIAARVKQSEAAAAASAQRFAARAGRTEVATR